ncbi:MAG: ABC transporter substrate-binding protein [Bacteroidota bacterium]
MKKFTIILLLLFSSCGKNDDRTPVEFWTLQLSPTFNEYFTSLIAEYEKRHPNVRIIWVDVPYDAAIQKLLSSAVAGNAPDVVNLSADFLAKFHGMKALADITTEVQQCGYTFLPNALELCTYNEQIIALPWYLNSYIVIYNKDHILASGFSAADVPVTYTDLIRFIKSYKDRTDKFAIYWNIGKDSYLPMMLASEGIEMTDRSMTRALFNSDRTVELIDQWVQLYRQGYLPSESIIKPGSAIVEAYQSGQVAMILTGPVFLQRIRTNAPKIYSKTDVAPVVTGATGRHDLAAMALSVLNSSTHKKEAIDFALFVTHPENQLAFSKLTTTYPSVIEALRDTFFASGNSSLVTKARNLGASQLSSATRLRAYLDHPEFDKLRDSFDEAIQNACLGTLSTQEALNKSVSEWNDILQKTR